MFEPGSRYFAVKTKSIVTPDGRTIAYKARRFLPRGENLILLAEVKTTQADRLDLIAARTLGDPLQFWRICDANNAMDPLALTEEPGTVLRVPVPEA